MGGNEIGARKGAKTQKELYGEDFHKKIGALGGAKSKGRIPWNKGKKLKKVQDEGNS